MGWLVSALIALLVLSVVAWLAPAVFGPVVAGLAPLLVVIALIGLGGVWWRRSQGRIDPEVGDESADIRGETEHPET
jgi:hypothetical protein